MSINQGDLVLHDLHLEFWDLKIKHTFTSNHGKIPQHLFQICSFQYQVHLSISLDENWQSQVPFPSISHKPSYPSHSNMNEFLSKIQNFVYCLPCSWPGKRYFLDESNLPCLTIWTGFPPATTELIISQTTLLIIIKKDWETNAMTLDRVLRISL